MGARAWYTTLMAPTRYTLLEQTWYIPHVVHLIGARVVVHDLMAPTVLDHTVYNHTYTP